MVARRVIPLAILILGTVESSLAWAYWADGHETINDSVLNNSQPFAFTRGGHQVSSVDDYMRTQWLMTNGMARSVTAVPFARPELGPLGMESDTPGDEPTAANTLEQWNSKGGLWEDGVADFAEALKWGGLRAVNHWVNPLASATGGANGQGYTGVLSMVGIDLTPNILKSIQYLGLLGGGISAADWATGSAGNSWGFNGLAQSMQQFLTDSDPEYRESGAGCSMRAIGQIQHLVEDNTVPDHTRNLPHPGEGFEEFCSRRHPELFQLASGYIVMTLDKIDKGGSLALWSQDLYDGTDPILVADPNDLVGIAEFTNANFLAFNRLSASQPGMNPFIGVGLSATGPIDFTTIPSLPNQGFTGSVGTFPWPEFDNARPGFPTADPSAAGTFPLADLAFGPVGVEGASNNWHVGDDEWAGYAVPLMAVAHGYAQTVLALTLPPLDAEIIPDATDPLGTVHVMLWNLGDSQTSGNALTWKVQSIAITPIADAPSPVDTLIFAGDDQSISVAGTPTIGAGTNWTSDAVALSALQRHGLDRSHHVSVMVTASVGQGNPVTLTFGAIIPSAYVSLEQETTSGNIHGEESPQATIEVNCITDCLVQAPGGNGWANGSIYQELQQTVTGNINIYSSRRDVLGESGDDTLIKIQKDLAHLAGVALVSLADPQNPYFTNWHIPINSTLKIDNSHLVQAPGSQTVWIRDPTHQKDAEPMGVTFTANLDIAAEAAQYGSAATASNGFYLVGWSTSGEQWIEKLVLWETESSQPASYWTTLQTCPVVAPYLGTSSGYQSFCGQVSDDGVTCKSGADSQTWVTATDGAVLGSSSDPVVSNYYSQIYAPIVPQTLGGMAVPLNEMLAGVATACDPNTINQPASPGPGPCELTGQSSGLLGAVILGTWTSSPGSACPDPTLPGLSPPMLATYQRDTTAIVDRVVMQALGQSAPVVSPHITFGP